MRPSKGFSLLNLKLVLREKIIFPRYFPNKSIKICLVIFTLRQDSNNSKKDYDIKHSNCISKTVYFNYISKRINSIMENVQQKLLALDKKSDSLIHEVLFPL